MDERIAKVKIAPGTTVQVLASAVSLFEAHGARRRRQGPRRPQGSESGSRQEMSAAVLVRFGPGRVWRRRLGVTRKPAHERVPSETLLIVAAASRRAARLSLLPSRQLLGPRPRWASSSSGRSSRRSRSWTARGGSRSASSPPSSSGRSSSLWPTFEELSRRARSSARRTSRSSITFGIVKGLDLQGGLRLVYTVEVEEAIRDKRDKFADEMRQSSRTTFKIHTGEGLLKREELRSSTRRSTSPRPRRAVLQLKFKDPADVEDRSTTASRRSSPASSRRCKGERRRGRLQDPRGGRDADPRARRHPGQGDRPPPRRRARPARGQRHDARRGHHHRGPGRGRARSSTRSARSSARRRASSSRWSTTRPTSSARSPRRQGGRPPEGHRRFVDRERAASAPARRKHDVTSRCIDEAARSEDDARQALQALRSEVGRDAQRPRRPRVGFEKTDDYDEDTGKSRRTAGARSTSSASAEVTGDYITDAQARRDQSERRARRLVRRDARSAPRGADRFEEITGANIKRRFAIILDDEVESAPVIQTQDRRRPRAASRWARAIPSSSSQDAEKLELVLRSGALPAPISPSNEQRIGPTLGKDAIAQGVKGALAGAGLVLLFMVVYYRSAGFIADIAVLFNLLLQLAILASFSAHDDAARHRRPRAHHRHGGRRQRAHQRAHPRGAARRARARARRSRSATTRRSAPSSTATSRRSSPASSSRSTARGPIKGFAVTLIVGIVASLFTGVVCTRLMFDWWVRGAKVKRLSVGFCSRWARYVLLGRCDPHPHGPARRATQRRHRIAELATQESQAGRARHRTYL